MSNCGEKSRKYAQLQFTNKLEHGFINTHIIYESIKNQLKRTSARFRARATGATVVALTHSGNRGQTIVAFPSIGAITASVPECRKLITF